MELYGAAGTEAGMILGTAAYLAPEQARGTTIDKRADVWAFGVVLFEMLMGQRLFAGATVSDTLAAVLTREPDWMTLPAGTPAPIRRLLRRCLEKDRKRRLTDAGAARLEIDVSLANGEVRVLCDAAAFGGSWGPDGTILFELGVVGTSTSAALGRVSAAGGIPAPVTTAGAPGESHRYPAFLPGGRHFLYLLLGGKAETSGIYLGSMDGTPAVRLLPDQSNAVYVPADTAARDGHLLFRRGTALMALPFNVERRQAAGEMFPVAQQVSIAGNAAHGGFSVSADGTLVYLPYSSSWPSRRAAPMAGDTETSGCCRSKAIANPCRI